MRLKLKDLLPNPYRDLKNNPLNLKTIERLKKSIDTTGFWDNVVVRKNSEGKYEIAYGHHRIEAAKQCGIEEADFIVRKFTDVQMIQVLHDDNDEAYKFKTASLFESVRGIVNALAAGKIGPFEIPKDTKTSAIRYAPSFVPGKGRSPESGNRAYTILNVAMALNETKKHNGSLQPTEAIRAVVNALHLIEIGQLTEKSLYGRPLDSPNGGLIQVIQAAFINIEDARKREAINAKLVEETAKASKVVQQKQVENLQKRTDKVRKEETKKSAPEEPAPSYKEQLQTKKEKAKANASNIAVKGPQLEAAVAERTKLDPEEVKRNTAANILRQQIDAMVETKLENLALQNKEVLRRELDYLWRQVQDTTQRMRIFNALNKASTFFDEQSQRFTGKPPRLSAKDVLAEAYQKEEARRKHNVE